MPRFVRILLRHCLPLGPLLLLLLPLALSLPAGAHPHVWVVYETAVVYDGGKIVGLRHKWTFDEMYTTMAIDGLDTDKDGKYSREELAELAKVNMEGLVEFDYFSFAKLGDKPLKFKAPVDYYLEHKDDALSFNFTLPLEEPVPGDASAFTFSIYDPSFFIAFDPARENAFGVVNAPEGCKAVAVVSEKEKAERERLKAAFGTAATAGDANIGTGISFAQTVGVACGKS